MNFKIDTKEKFTVIEPLEPALNDNLAVALYDACVHYLDEDIKNIILNLKSVISINKKVADMFVELHQEFYNNDASLVLCNICVEVVAFLKNDELDDILNCTPTESEAWDIVQMEEIERELLGGDDFLSEE